MQAEITTHDTIQHPEIYKDEFFGIYGESKPFGTLVHCHVYNWNKAVYNHLLYVWGTVLELSGDTKYYVIAKDKKLKKFAMMCGFITIDEIHDREGNLVGEMMQYV